jgi:hypothetical protein
MTAQAVHPRSSSSDSSSSSTTGPLQGAAHSCSAAEYWGRGSDDVGGGAVTEERIDGNCSSHAPGVFLMCKQCTIAATLLALSKQHMWHVDSVLERWGFSDCGLASVLTCEMCAAACAGD